MIIPDICVTDFLTNRDMRLAPTLAGVRVRELLRFTDACDKFIKLFPLQYQFIATLFHEQQLDPMLKAYKEAEKILTSYQNVKNTIRQKRKDLENLCMNGSVTCLSSLACEIQTLEENQKNLSTNFHEKCSNLYPSNIINNYINNTIQHN